MSFTDIRMEGILVLSFLFLQIVSYTSAQGMNVAVNQNASQFDTLNWIGFNWTADKAVDNCTLQDDPDTQQCCSSTLGTTQNFIRVDFDRPYNISSIVLFGRADGGTQTKDFRIKVVNGNGEENMIYDNACCEYGNGIFTIPLNDTTILSIVVTRPTESILTVCEIQAFESIPMTVATTASTMAPTAAPTASTMAPTAAPTAPTAATTASTAAPTAETTADQSQTSSPDQSQNTTLNQGQSTAQSQTTTPDQGDQTTGSNSVTGIHNCSDVIIFLLLTAFFVWKTI